MNIYRCFQRMKAFSQSKILDDQAKDSSFNHLRINIKLKIRLSVFHFHWIKNHDDLLIFNNQNSLKLFSIRWEMWLSSWFMFRNRVNVWTKEWKVLLNHELIACDLFWFHDDCFRLQSISWLKLDYSLSSQDISRNTSFQMILLHKDTNELIMRISKNSFLT